MKMYKIAVVIVGLTGLLLADTVSVAVVSGRKVQRDGLLLEWTESTAQKIATTPQIRADFSATSEGVAGYVSVDSVQSFGVQFASGEQREIIRADSTLVATRSWYAVSKSLSGKSLIVEFVVPWSMCSRDSSGGYRLDCTVAADSAQNFHTIKIAGTYGVVPAGTKHTLILQILAISILLVFYFVFTSRSRRRKGQILEPRR